MSHYHSILAPHPLPLFVNIYSWNNISSDGVQLMEENFGGFYKTDDF